MTCSGRIKFRSKGRRIIWTWWPRVNYSKWFFDFITSLSWTKISWWRSATGRQVESKKPPISFSWVTSTLFPDFFSSQGTCINQYIAGVTAWYAFNNVGVSEFEKDIQNALPLLKTLAKFSRVVWLNQVPLIPVDYPHPHHKEVVNEKVLPMNRFARRVLQ